MAGGSGDVEAEKLPEAEEKDERDHPQPDPPAHAPAPRIAGREQPEGVSHPLPAKVPCSRLVRIRVRTNCQMSPAVMHSSKALMNAVSPPPSRAPSKGATNQARTAMGMAAAAHTARI